MTEGGEGTSGRVHSEETRQKIGKSKEGKKFSALSDALRGRSPSEETRLKMSASQQGKKHTLIRRQNMRTGHLKRMAKGVSFAKRANKWRAYYAPEMGEQVFIGYFATEQEALAARQAALDGQTLSRHPRYKLTETQVLEILTLHKQGWKQAALAQRFGIRPNTISQICSGRRWSKIHDKFASPMPTWADGFAESLALPTAA